MERWSLISNLSKFKCKLDSFILILASLKWIVAYCKASVIALFHWLGYMHQVVTNMNPKLSAPWSSTFVNNSHHIIAKIREVFWRLWVVTSDLPDY